MNAQLSPFMLLLNGFACLVLKVYVTADESSQQTHLNVGGAYQAGCSCVFLPHTSTLNWHKTTIIASTHLFGRMKIVIVNINNFYIFFLNKKIVSKHMWFVKILEPAAIYKNDKKEKRKKNEYLV